MSSDQVAKLVFSAHAEVVPLCDVCYSMWCGILRARGGSSQMPEQSHDGLPYSPRTRR